MRVVELAAAAAGADAGAAARWDAWWCAGARAEGARLSRPMAFPGEFGAELVAALPFAHALAACGVLRATASVGATDALYAPWSPSHARAAGRRAEGQLAWWGALGSYFDPQLFLWSPPPLRDAHACLLYTSPSPRDRG